MNLYQYLFHIVDTGGAKYYIKSFSDFFSFFIFIIPSVFFLIKGIKLFKKQFITILFIMTLSFLIFLLFILGGSGAADGRYFFNLLGPFIYLISGLGFNSFFHQNENKLKSYLK